MPRHLSVLRIRAALASAFTIALCAGVCFAVLWWTSFSSGLNAERRVLEAVSNMPFDADVEVGAGTVSYAASSAPKWLRLSVAGDGTIEGADASGCKDALDGSDDVGELIALRDSCGSDPFAWGGRTWIALWQPMGPQENSVVVSADGAVLSTSAAEGDIRLYTFLDVSDFMAQAGGFAVGLGLTCIALLLVAGAVAWIVAGCALRPVADTEERQRAFVFSASHELVTPLMAVTANCDVLEVEAFDQEALAPWIANIRSAADDMASRIARMLTQLR